jgi:hypothetical protein
MRSLAFAWRRLVRQPGRAVLGILGVAAVGALLFDMLLLSRGLVVSLADQLDRVGFDIRVTAGDGLPIVGERIQRASEQVALVAGLAEVEAVAAMEVARGWVLWPDARTGLTLVGGTPGRHAGWRLVEGRDLDEATGPYPGVVVSRSVLTDYVPALDRTMTAGIGELLTLRGDCLDGVSAVLPVTFEIVGVGEFPFDGESSRLAAGPRRGVWRGIFGRGGRVAGGVAKGVRRGGGHAGCR